MHSGTLEKWIRWNRGKRFITPLAPQSQKRSHISSFAPTLADLTPHFSGTSGPLPVAKGWCIRWIETGKPPASAGFHLLFKQRKSGLGSWDSSGSRMWVEGQLQWVNMMRKRQLSYEGNHTHEESWAEKRFSSSITGKWIANRSWGKLGHIIHLFVQYAQADDIRRTESPRSAASTSNRVQAPAKQAISLTPTVFLGSHTSSFSFVFPA